MIDEMTTKLIEQANEEATHQPLCVASSFACSMSLVIISSIIFFTLPKGFSPTLSAIIERTRESSLEARDSRKAATWRWTGAFSPPRRASEKAEPPGVRFFSAAPASSGLDSKSEDFCEHCASRAER